MRRFGLCVIVLVFIVIPVAWPLVFLFPVADYRSPRSEQASRLWDLSSVPAVAMVETWLGHAYAKGCRALSDVALAEAAAIAIGVGLVLFVIARIVRDAFQVMPTAVVDHPSASTGGVVVRTLVGPLVFPDTHAIGRLGDHLCHLYFSGSDTARIYEKMRSKRDTVHGLDVVYLKNPRRGRLAVVVIENKVNKSPYSPSQLSDDAIKRQCELMKLSSQQSVRETADVVWRAVHRVGDRKIERLLMRHDLVRGVTIRTRVNERGHVIRFSSRRRSMARRLRAILEGRITDGTYVRACAARG